MPQKHGFNEAALEHGLLSGSQLDALCPDLEAIRLGCEHAGSCSWWALRSRRIARLQQRVEVFSEAVSKFAVPIDGPLHE